MELLILTLTFIGGIASIIAIYEFFIRIEYDAIKVEVIKMSLPKINGSVYMRNPVDRRQAKFANMENHLRKKAYALAPIETKQSFFDDRDMHAEYYLYVVYNSKDETPLLSIRLYYSGDDIKAELKGTNPSKAFMIHNPNTNKMSSWAPDEIDKYEFGECFILDRMSADFGNAYYKTNRSKIMKRLYKAVYQNNRTAKVFYALARRSVKEALLTKYLRLGLRIIGMAEYFGKDHWVLEGRYHCIKEHFQYTTTLNKEMN